MLSRILLIQAKLALDVYQMFAASTIGQLMIAQQTIGKQTMDKLNTSLCLTKNITKQKYLISVRGSKNVSKVFTEIAECDITNIQMF